MSRRDRLKLVGSGRPAGRAGSKAPGERTVFRRRRHPPRSRKIFEALLLMAGGIGLLVLLLQLPELVDLDSLLLLSTAIGHLIGGLSQLLAGVLQLLGVLLLVALALLALLLLVAGLVRLVRAVLAPPLPQPPARPVKRR